MGRRSVGGKEVDRAGWEAGRRKLGGRDVARAERELAVVGELGEEDLAAVREWLAEHPPT